MRSVAETEIRPTSRYSSSEQRRWWWGSVTSSRYSCCLCLPHCACTCGSAILHAAERSPDQVISLFYARILSKFKGFYRSFFLTWYATTVVHHFLTENYFSCDVYVYYQSTFVLTV